MGGQRRKKRTGQRRPCAPGASLTRRPGAQAWPSIRGPAGEAASRAPTAAPRWPALGTPGRASPASPLRDKEEPTRSAVPAWGAVKKEAPEREPGPKPAGRPALPDLPLQERWALWFDKHWAHQCCVMSFASVKDFWCMYNHLSAPETLPTKSNISLFKAGVRPQWEDPANKSGGKWVICLRGHRDLLDDLWLTMCLALIGGSLPRKEVCGIVLNIRYGGDRFAVWTASVDLKAQAKLGAALCALGKFPAGTLLEFKAHEASIENASAYIAPALLTLQC